MINLLNPEKINYVIVYKNDYRQLKNILLGDRKERYLQANRDITKYKLLSGSCFVYGCLRGLGFSEEISKKAFSERSSHLIDLPTGEMSYSNSGDYHVLTYSMTDSTGVDVEIYKDRPNSSYVSFLNVCDDSQIDYKKIFYKKWLEKEILFKQNKVKRIKYFFVENYICGYAFGSAKDVKVIRLQNLMTHQFDDSPFCREVL